MNNNNIDSQTRGTLWQRLLGVLGSMNLAILLLVTLCLITLAGTLTSQNQPLEFYTNLYGPFWTAFFQFIQLFELYSSPWFLVLVTLLIISIATCVWRNAPNILASFGRDAKEYHPGKFSKERHWDVNSLNSSKLAELKNQFIKRGYLVTSRTIGDELHIHANKGGQQKLGYLFIHISILIIFLGGLLDGNVFMAINEPGYSNALNSYDTKLADVPADKILPATNSAFSAIRTFPLGRSEDTVVIPEKGGYYLQKLPFRIHLTDINTHYYANGTPKDYMAGIEIVDEKKGKTLAGMVNAGKSLSYNGYTIAHRGYAGSNAQLTLSLYKFDSDKALIQDETIGLPYQVGEPDTGRVVFDDYKNQNADPSRKIDISDEFVDIGSSIHYQIMKADGDAVNVEYYMEPYEKDGSKYYLLRVTHATEKPSLIFVPIDNDANLQRFLSFNHILYKKDLIRLLFSSKLEDLFKELELDSDYLRKQTINQVISLLNDYAQYGREVAIANQIQGIKEADQETASLYMEKILDYALYIMYEQVVVHEEQAKAPNNNAAKVSIDMNYFNELKQAVDQFKELGIGYFPVISKHSQEQGVMLSVSRQPGKYVVLGGMLMLILGVLAIFYINYREYLIRILPGGGGATIRVNAYTNRSDTQFNREFVNITDVLISVSL